ncbi:MAG TPA: prepilin-type N-terminal cleavage/methylation domain-containing protein [Burkholderiaceae bacterium]|nr:prepilin-type N-terminal cleavage/methylation domain-containing protein [Burkholderiaceae bacterium]
MNPHRRGITLVEVLVCLLVLTVGLAAVSRLQSHLRLSAEAARQRAEALRLAQNEMERLRAFTRVAAGAGPSYVGIKSIGPMPVEDASASTRYTLERHVATSAAPRFKAVTLTARWSDRTGDAQQVELPSMVAGLAPALGGVLTLQRQVAESLQPLGRHPAIPLTARDLGGGRSVFKPSTQAVVAWVFDAITGVIIQVCQAPAGVANADLQEAQLSRCATTQGLLVSGFVRFATQTDTPGARDAEQPTSPALNLDLCLVAANTALCTAPSLAECFDDAPAAPSPTRQTVIYHCAVFPPAGTLHWTGRLNLVPVDWQLAVPEVAGGFKVCRYSFDHNANGRIDNAEHPALYTKVTAPLTDQNFLVVRGAATCPVDQPVSLGSVAPDNVVNDSTVQHQP